jgi:hypothetical protein
MCDGVLAVRRRRERVGDLDSGVGDVVQAIRRVFLQAALDEPADRVRHVGGQRRPVRLALEQPRDTVGRGVRSERAAGREHFEEHAAERPHVGAFVHGHAARLLGTHVRRRAEDEPRMSARRGQVRRVGVGDLSDAEVEHLHLSRGSELDVRGLQVAMDDAALMGGLERRRNLPCDGERLLDGQPAAGESLGERRTLDELEDEAADAVGLLEPVNRADVRMVE